MLAISAWCLGILNSHHKFLLSYASGVVWNVAMIATLILFGAGTTLPRLAVLLAWGSVVGSVLQFLVQLPGRAAGRAGPAAGARHHVDPRADDRPQLPAGASSAAASTS